MNSDRDWPQGFPEIIGLVEDVTQALKALREAAVKQVEEGPKRDVKHTMLLSTVISTTKWDIGAYELWLQDWRMDK